MCVQGTNHEHSESLSTPLHILSDVGAHFTQRALLRCGCCVQSAITTTTATAAAAATTRRVSKVNIEFLSYFSLLHVPIPPDFGECGDGGVWTMLRYDGTMANIPIKINKINLD